MKTTIDRAGRLVIPRAMRTQLGLERGGDVEVSIDGASIRIEPTAGSELADIDGLLVIPATGEPIDDEVVRELRRADQR
ncbi:MAG TPA: AbrB/MazE/SpoVT family DNA-binding domain-containing protein [Candidatus Limnocylindrales bacterium]|nr:AbrB/MazE/SpoVT family DNA-binding domain-containing protein [Candidatus Limnocylindrales bacterium]